MVLLAGGVGGGDALTEVVSLEQPATYTQVALTCLLVGPHHRTGCLRLEASRAAPMGVVVEDRVVPRAADGCRSMPPS